MRVDTAQRRAAAVLAVAAVYVIIKLAYIGHSQHLLPWPARAGDTQALLAAADVLVFASFACWLAPAGQRPRKLRVAWLSGAAVLVSELTQVALSAAGVPGILQYDHARSGVLIEGLVEGIIFAMAAAALAALTGVVHALGHRSTGLPRVGVGR